jgi:hypothetical protein
MLNDFQYRMLEIIAPGEPQKMNGSAYDGKSKIGVLLGDDFLTLVRDKTVIDFGCGNGVGLLASIFFKALSIQLQAMLRPPAWTTAANSRPARMQRLMWL